MTAPHVAAIYRYPVKGMTPERLESVLLAPGQTLPFDRAYAIENGPGRFDPDAPRHLPKINFLMLMRNERLATLDARFDDASETLTISRNGKQLARGQLTTALGRQLIEQFLAAYMKADLRGAPRIVSADSHSFSDVAAKCLHIVNYASVRDLERSARGPIDPLRFRPNLVIDGVESLAELGWPGRRLSIGTCVLEVFARTQRCEAINVDPSTGNRDIALTAEIPRRWQHSDFGVYANVILGGELRAGAELTVDSDA